MKITLVAHYLDKSLGYGMSRYAYGLLKGLQAKGIEVKTLSCPYVVPSPLKSAFDFFIYIPLISLLPSGTQLFHFALQQTGFAIPLLKLIYRKKVVATVHDINCVIFPSSKSSWILKKAIEWSIKKSDSVIVISSQTKQDIVDTYGVPPDKISVVPIGVSDKFKPIKKPKSKIFTVGYIGGFAPHKDVQYLIRAYSVFEKKNGKSMLLLYGKGSQYEDCLSLAKKLGIKNIEFRGFADETKLVEIYNSFDVFVFPSQYEGQGLPLLEAQKCNVSVVVRQDGHLPEEVTKYCLKAKSESHMAEILYELSEKPQKISQEHLKHLELFTWEKCISDTIAVYDKTLKENKS